MSSCNFTRSNLVVHDILNRVIRIEEKFHSDALRFKYDQLLGENKALKKQVEDTETKYSRVIESQYKEILNLSIKLESLSNLLKISENSLRSVNKSTQIERSLT